MIEQLARGAMALVLLWFLAQWFPEFLDAMSAVG
jgi:hypothetical protein